MIPYLLESSVCMAVSLIGYRLLFGAEKNLYFNRGYLLFTLALSLLIPLLDIATNSYPDVSHMSLDAFSTAGSNLRSDAFGQTPPNFDSGSWFNPAIALGIIYGAGLAFMLCRFIMNLLRLAKLIGRSEHVMKEGYCIVLVTQEIVPFSFVHWIFVSGIAYRKGEIYDTIWSHEMTHVRQFHSMDNILLEVLLVFFYFHPLIWAYRHVIRLNHEYTADDHVLKSHPDVEAYAYQLIRFPGSKGKLLFESNFDYISTKKRIKMLTKSKESKVLFMNKVLIGMFVVFGTAALLSFRNLSKQGIPTGNNDLPIVVIDLGHGGNDVGGSSEDGRVTEVQILNAIGSIIREMSSADRIIFTRDLENVPLADRARFASTKNAKLLLSLHISASDDPKQHGVEIYYSDANIAAHQSKEVSQSFADKLLFRSGVASNEIKKGDFIVLKDSSCPAVLLSLGFLSNDADLEYLTTRKNQEDLAKQIVAILHAFSQ